MRYFLITTSFLLFAFPAVAQTWTPVPVPQLQAPMVPQYTPPRPQYPQQVMILPLGDNRFQISSPNGNQVCTRLGNQVICN